MLDWSRLQLNKIEMNFELITPNLLIERAIAHVEAQKNKKNINFLFENNSKYFVLVDAKMIITVLMNIFSNAIKFSFRGNNVEFVVTQEAEFIVISVADFGIGIDESKRKNIFSASKVKSNEGTEKESGTGLGLLLANEFVLKNKGKITIKPNEPTGSIFNIYLPQSS